MDIQAIREQITDAAALIAMVLNAIVGIVFQFATAKKLILKQVDGLTKKMNLWNPLYSRGFYA